MIKRNGAEHRNAGGLPAIFKKRPWLQGSPVAIDDRWKWDALKDTVVATERERINSLSGGLFVSRAFRPFSTVGHMQLGGRVGHQKCPRRELGMEAEEEEEVGASNNTGQTVSTAALTLVATNPPTSAGFSMWKGSHWTED